MRITSKKEQIISKKDFNKMYKLTINGKVCSVDDLGSDYKVVMMLNKLNDYLRHNLPSLGVPYTVSMNIEDMSIKIYYK